MDFICMIQAGLVGDDARRQLARRFFQLHDDLSDKTETDFAVRWIEIAEGSGFTGGARSSSSVTTAIVPDSITTDERVRVLSGICDAWTDVTGCTQHEVVAAAVNAGYDLQAN